jgi:hypothetical protein
MTSVMDILVASFTAFVVWIELPTIVGLLTLDTLYRNRHLLPNTLNTLC